MMCRACQEQEKEPEGGGGEKRRVERRKSPEPVNHDRKLEGRIPDQLCSRCGRLVGPEDTVKKVRDKHSQLEGFGLAGKRKPLLERKRRRKDH